MKHVRFLAAALATASSSGSIFAAESGLKLESYISYDKTSVVLSPTPAAIAQAKSLGLDTPKFITFEPNAMPSAGVEVSFMSFGASADRSLPQTQKSVAERGQSTISRYEIHNNQGWFGVDVYRDEYQGFFQSSINPGIQPFQDSLFKIGDSFETRPNMKLTVDAATATIVFLPNHFSLNDALNQASPKLKTGLSPLLMLSAMRTTLSDSSALVPTDQAAAYGSDAQVTGGQFETIGAAPGLGAILAAGNWFLNPVGFCGLAVQQQDFYGIDRQKPYMQGGLCDLRGALGYSSGSLTAGLVGYKHVETVTVTTLEISPTQSSIKLFISARL